MITICRIGGDAFDVNSRSLLHERIGSDDGEPIADGELNRPRRRVEVEGEDLVAGLDIPELGGLICATGDEAGGVTRDVAAPNGAVVAAVGAEALAVVGEPDVRGVVLGAGEEEVAVAVVLEEGQGPLVPFHQNRPHLLRATAKSDGGRERERERVWEERF